jgi:hypothetical protein
MVTVTSAELVEARLRAALTLVPHATAHGVDMSAAAIDARLRDACEMSALCLELAELSPDAPAPSRAAEPCGTT